MNSYILITYEMDVLSMFKKKQREIYGFILMGMNVWRWW